MSDNLPTTDNHPITAMQPLETAVIPPETIDRVGNVTQKENALAKAGVTRLAKAQVIYRLLHAKKKTEKLVDGNIIIIEEDDLVMQAKGAELASKEFGDLKEFERVEKSDVKIQNIVIVRNHSEEQVTINTVEEHK